MAISIILPVKAPISIIVSVTAVSATAVSNRYLRGWPLPYFSSSYSSALGDSWGLVNKDISLVNLTDSYSSTRSYKSNK